MDMFTHLNYDVLNMILSLLSPCDAGNLARTCKAAYHYAIPRFLSDVTLGLRFHRKPRSQLWSFCRFVLSNSPNRAMLLRRLDLRRDAFPWVEVEVEALLGNPRPSRAYTVDYSLAGLLAEVIQQADALEEVHVAGADPLLASEPQLADALASRCRLRHLTLEKCGSVGLECISRLSGDVRSLSLTVDDRYVRESSLYRNLSALSLVARTLQHLDVDDAIFVTGGLGPDVVLPAVRQLTLRGWADLSEILRIVPGLRILRLHTCRFRLSTFPPPVDPPRAELDELITDAHVPLRCTVRRVELQFNAFLQHDALAMLERMDPVVLSSHAGWSLPARDVARRLPSLQHLEMHVKWRISDGVPDTPSEAWLVSYAALSASDARRSSLPQTSLVSVFSQLKLLGLVLHIGRGVMTDPTIPLDVLARDIVNACNPSLRFIGVSLGLAVPTWYRCVRDDGPAGLRTRIEELPSWEGDLVGNRLRSLDRLHRDT